MKRTYIDISQSLITRGDVLILLDDNNPEISITVRVNAVEDNPDWDHRILNCLVVATSEVVEGFTVGLTVDIELSRTTPTRAVHIKNVDLDATLSYIEKQEQILAAIVEFLNQRVGQNFRANYKEILTLLESGGYIDPAKSYETNKKYLTGLLRQNTKYFNITGKYVQYTGRPFISSNQPETIRNEAVQKRVRWGKFIQGVRLIFEALGYRIDD